MTALRYARTCACANLMVMRAFAETRLNTTIVQQAVGQLS